MLCLIDLKGSDMMIGCQCQSITKTAEVQNARHKPQHMLFVSWRVAISGNFLSRIHKNLRGCNTRSVTENCCVGSKSIEKTTIFGNSTYDVCNAVYVTSKKGG